jgi:hypothetical protein
VNENLKIYFILKNKINFFFGKSLGKKGWTPLNINRAIKVVGVGVLYNIHER